MCFCFEATQAKVMLNIDEFCKAIICVMEAALSMHANRFVHRDIRWPNIAYDPNSESYLLLDFEQIGTLCNSDKSCTCPKEEYCSPPIYDAASIIRLFSESEFKQLENYANLAKELKLDQILKSENQQTEVKKLFWEFYENNSK